MRILIVEDDYASREFLVRLLARYGKCDQAVDGIEAVEAFVRAHHEGKPYQFLCLDIMMPKIDGLRALATMREFEKKKGLGEKEQCKVLIISALDDAAMGFQAANPATEVYAVKPVDIAGVEAAMAQLGLFH